MSLENNSENRTINTSQRCCSFCRRAGHNITRCNSQAILIFERNTLNYINFEITSEISIVRSEQLKNYLLNEALVDSNLIKAFAISRCGANSRTNLVSCIDLIIEYFMFENIQNLIQVQPEPREGRGFHMPYNLERQARRARLTSRVENQITTYAVMFMEFIAAINNEEIPLNRKFNIKTKISEEEEGLNKLYECGICYDEYEKSDFVKIDCGHEFCKNCIKKLLQNERKQTPCCAFCRSDIKNFEIKHESIKNEFNELIICESQI